MEDYSLDAFDKNIKKNILAYLNGQYDDDDKILLKKMIKDSPREVEKGFYKNLSFGTGGIREIMGIGINRLNKYTIRAASFAVCTHFQEFLHKKEIKVAISYDTRNQSRAFAEETAKVMMKNGAKVFLYKGVAPTPLLSFAVREKGCDLGIMITASHNTSKYNGYKVYGSDGAQIVFPHDKSIEKRLSEIKDPSKVEYQKDLKVGITYLGDELFQKYIEKLKILEKVQKENRNLSIVYTSLHGTGIVIMDRVMKRYGFNNFSLVEKQCSLDGNFPNAPSPNPENIQALQLGIDKMMGEKKDVLIATDPDADRLAIAINHKNSPIIFTGNQIAAILFKYLLEIKKDVSENSFVMIKTIVTSELLSKIANDYKIHSEDVLTGFKYIAEKIRIYEKENKYKFIFGAEESLGYLPVDFVRDKDSISSAFLIANLADELKEKNGKTLYDYLVFDIYEKHGFFKESLFSINFEEGPQGMDKMNSIMDSLRENAPKEFLSTSINIKEDYEKGEKIYLNSNKSEKIDLPKSNVIRYFLEDESKIVIRPSGTEPKLKIYLGVSKNDFSNEIDSFEKLKFLDEKLKKLEIEIKSYLNI